MKYAIAKTQLDAAIKRKDFPAMVYWQIKINELEDIWK